MCNPEYEKLVNDPVMEAIIEVFEPDTFRQAVVEAAKLPSIDRLRKQHRDIVELFIAKHKQMVDEIFLQKITVAFDDEVQPDHVVQS